MSDNKPSPLIFGEPTKCRVCTDEEYCDPANHHSPGKVNIRSYSSYNMGLSDLLGADKKNWPDYIIQSPVISQNFLNHLDIYPDEIQYSNIISTLDYLSRNLEFQISKDILWLFKLYKLSSLTKPFTTEDNSYKDLELSAPPLVLFKNEASGFDSENPENAFSVGILIRRGEKEWKWYNIIIQKYNKPSVPIKKTEITGPPFYVKYKWLSFLDPYWLEESKTAPKVVLAIIGAAASIVVIVVAVAYGVAAAGGWFSVSMSSVSLVSNIDDITTDEQDRTFLTRTFPNYRTEIESSKFILAIISLGGKGYKVYKIPKTDTKPIVKIASVVGTIKTSISASIKAYSVLNKKQKEIVEKKNAQELYIKMAKQLKIELDKDSKSKIIEQIMLKENEMNKMTILQFE